MTVHTFRLMLHLDRWLAGGIVISGPPVWPHAPSPAFPRASRDPFENNVDRHRRSAEQCRHSVYEMCSGSE
jgi:hypothetical protein